MDEDGGDSQQRPEQNHQLSDCRAVQRCYHRGDKNAGRSELESGQEALRLLDFTFNERATFVQLSDDAGDDPLRQLLVTCLLNFKVMAVVQFFVRYPVAIVSVPQRKLAF